MKTSLFFKFLLALPVPSFDLWAFQAKEPSLMDTLDEYIDILAPLLILAVVVIVGYAIFAATRTEVVQGAAKTECKGEIMVAMRKNVAGLTVREIAQMLKISEGQAQYVLDEMKADRQVYETEHRGKKVWRLHGIGEGGVWV